MDEQQGPLNEYETEQMTKLGVDYPTYVGLREKGILKPTNDDFKAMMNDPQMIDAMEKVVNAPTDGRTVPISARNGQGILGVPSMTKVGQDMMPPPNQSKVTDGPRYTGQYADQSELETFNDPAEQAENPNQFGLGGGSSFKGYQPGDYNTAGYDKIAKAYKDQAGIEAIKYQTEAELLEKKNQILQDSIKQDELAEIEKKRIIEEKQAELQQLSDEIKNTKIDSGRFWSQKSTGEKILAGLALFLGGYGQGAYGTPNTALAQIDAAINRDIADQQANLAGKRDTLAEKRGLYQTMIDKFGDEASARAATKVAALGLVENELQAMNAKSGSKMSIAKGEAMMGEIQQKKYDAQAEFDIAQGKLAADMMTKMKDQSKQYYDLMVPGVGVAMNKDDVEPMKKAAISYNTTEGTINKVIALAENLSTYDAMSVYDESKVEINQLMELLRAQSRGEFLGPGAVTDTERELLKSILETPDNFSKWGRDRAIAKLKTVRDSLASRFNAEAKLRIRNFTTPEDTRKRLQGG